MGGTGELGLEAALEWERKCISLCKIINDGKYQLSEKGCISKKLFRELEKWRKYLDRLPVFKIPFEYFLPLCELKKELDSLLNKQSQIF